MSKMLNLPVYSVDETPDLSKVDCLCLVGELKNGETMPEMVSYVSKLPSGAVKMACYHHMQRSYRFQPDYAENSFITEKY